MSALSKSERDGLEDVFLSIHTNHEKFYTNYNSPIIQ